jgi:NitT/TauT family transport system substrate-binding protein
MPDTTTLHGCKAAVAVLLLLAAIPCGWPGPAVAAAEGKDAPVRIRFVTDWRAEAAHGGYYQAKARGFYAERGLDVQIIQGGTAVNVPLLLGAGRADFAIGSDSFIALNIVQAGVPATAVAAIFQKDPQVLITHPRDDVRSIADMRGKAIMISDAAVSTYWRWLKARFGFRDAQIRKYTHNLAPFLTNPQAIQQGYVTSEPYEIEKAGGFVPQVFMLADEGYPAYSGLILAADRHLQSSPALVRDFVAASVAGWKAYLSGDPAPGNALIKADNPEMTDDLLRHGIAEMNAHGLATAGDAAREGIGVMTDARWQAFFDVMAAGGVYPPDLDWRKAYSRDFLPPSP